MPRRRAMSSEHASDVKVSGHRNEEDFAFLIGGEINQGSHIDKKDVIDAQHRFHSVKAGTWWQVFLYGRERLRTNTIFQGLGNLADIMIACLDAYPETYENYLNDKATAKLKLQPQMRRLRDELDNPRLFRAFLEKSLFDGGNADYLSITLGAANRPRSDKVFHIFHKSDVVEALAQDVMLKNSQKRRAGQWDDQKVTFWSRHHRRNIGELEDRHDSRIHYKEMKFRLNAESVFRILNSATPTHNQVAPQVTVYGNAIRMFRLPN